MTRIEQINNNPDFFEAVLLLKDFKTKSFIGQTRKQVRVELNKFKMSNKEKLHRIELK